MFCKPDNVEPQYLTPESKVVKVSCQDLSFSAKTRASVRLLDIGAMLATSGLDASQQAAVAHALTHRLAIIQGPPGCGKTFVGLLLAQLLLNMDPTPPGPILVLTYKNHALDEFLHGLLAFLDLDDIVRIGGRSRMAELEACNLKNLVRKRPANRMLDQINALKDEIREANNELEELMLALHCSSVLTLQDLLEAWSEEQLRTFFITAPYTKGTVSVWFRKGKIADKKVVGELLETIPSVSSLLLNCLRNGNNSKKQDKNLCKLFHQLIKQWVPSADHFTQLKELETLFVNQMREAQTLRRHPIVLADTTEEHEELNDEEFVSVVAEARLAAQGRSGWQADGQSNAVLYSQRKKPAREVVHFQDFPFNMEENEELFGVNNFWDMTNHQRISLLYTILSQKIDNISSSLNKLFEKLESLTKQLNELTALQNAEILGSKKIIGMTATGASINQQLIQEVAPAIVIVEEAGEVLETDLLAALTAGIQHLILIGDHKQLRPNVKTHGLKEYNFDVSMMERLIGNQLSFKTLMIQNRMRPEFSQMLLDIYPDLQDNLPKVEKHQPASGLLKSMLFWNHSHPEKFDQSYSNIEEARRAVFLAEFLMGTGIKASKITILAAYQGQVKAIRNVMKSQEDLTMPINQSKKDVQVSTIDMFQGDENDFIIVSLVRSNSKGAIGFLMEESRRCVAQSRARCGLYFIGSVFTLTKKSGSPWISFLNSMQEGGWVSDTLDIQCSKHKNKSIASVADADELKDLFQQPEKLCKLSCDVMFSCGLHPCKKLCFPIHSHAACMKMVSFNHCACGHVDQKRCHEDAARIRCQKSVELNFSTCEHQKSVKCCQKQDHEKRVQIQMCTSKVVCVLPACGHAITKPCHVKLSDAICQSVVYYAGGCGHELSRECHLPISQVQCHFRPCAKLRHCGHPCLNKCGQSCDDGDCSSCQCEQEVRIKKSQQRAKIKARKLRQQIKESGYAYSLSVLEEDNPEYLDVFDRVTKYIQPMHNWYPQITCIEKVHNLKLEAEYEEYRTAAFGEHEALKFHGTSNAGIKDIPRNGFKIGSKPGMFGAGIYFATDSSKSSQEIYTKGSNKLLLCKVFLGRAKTVYKDDNTLTGERLRAERFDSVFAKRDTKHQGGVANDEFVVFDKRQAVAQFVIHYKTAGLTGARIDQLTAAGQPFQKVRMQPGRAIKLNDPLETAYRFAEGHFHRMSEGSQKTVSAITIVMNAKLAAKFEKTKKKFAKQKKGRLYICCLSKTPPLFLFVKF